MTTFGELAVGDVFAFVGPEYRFLHANVWWKTGPESYGPVSGEPWDTAQAWAPVVRMRMTERHGPLTVWEEAA